MPAKSDPKSKPTSGRLSLGRLLAALALVSLAAVAAVHGQSAAAAAPESASGGMLAEAATGEVPVPETPAGVLDIVAIQPFSLRTAYIHNWLASRPEVSSGLLVVLKVDPRYVHPRDAAEPVLYAGDRTIERLNQGERSGYVVGIVPGDATLATALVFFGSPELPEGVTAETLAEQRELAARAGIKPFTAEQIERVLREGVHAEGLADLLAGPAADLVMKYSPDEKKLAEDWRKIAGSR
jgi:hypothetical protein